MLDKCLVCSSPSDRQPEDSSDTHRIECLRCGRYRVTDTFGKLLEQRRRDHEFTAAQVANISGHLRENQDQLWTDSDLTQFETIRSPSALEKATKLMRFIRHRFPAGGIQFEIPYSDAEYVLDFIALHQQVRNYEADAAFTEKCKNILPYVAAAWSQDAGDFLFTFNEYIRKQETWIEQSTNQIGSSLFRITPKGWNFLDNLDVASPESRTGFVAMWYSDQTAEAWKIAIAPAITDAKYEPLRIDRLEHENRIDDEIIARIRGSKFLVADLTGYRGGVYWEAGFAYGLGRKVIWTVRSDYLSRTNEREGVHFDVRQFPFIVWQRDMLAEFRTALTNRIVARVGTGTPQPMHGHPA